MQWKGKGLGIEKGKGRDRQRKGEMTGKGGEERDRK